MGILDGYIHLLRSYVLCPFQLPRSSMIEGNAYTNTTDRRPSQASFSGACNWRRVHHRGSHRSYRFIKSVSLARALVLPTEEARTLQRA